MSITNTDHLAAVIRLADEVSQLAAQVHKAEVEHQRASKTWSDADRETRGPYPYLHASPKTTGELRRRSMDLSRALSELRRS